MNTEAKIYIAGHRGMVGSAIKRRLESQGYTNIIVSRSSELDLRRQADVEKYFEEHKPDYVFVAAARVGGIHANNVYRAEFIYDNLMIQSNIIHSSHLSGVKKLLFLGSSCIYPKFAKQPMDEGQLLAGKLEPTNEPYAIAKIAGIKMCQAYKAQYGSNFISAMPTNLYGPNDNYDLQNSHVLPALLRKMHISKKENAESVIMWGTGEIKREFLHVDDLADACLFLMNNYDGLEIVNIGTGTDVTIKELAINIKEIVGFEGRIDHDYDKPDGTPRKLLDVSKLSNLGWSSKINLKDGINSVYNSLENYEWY